MMTTYKRCFLCSTQVEGGGGKRKNPPSKILLQYLLASSENEDFKKAVLSSKSFRFCDNCDTGAKQIEELHMQLEAIQKKLTDKLKQMKDGVISKSKNFEDWLDQLLRDGGSDECDTAEMELCRQFHSFIRDNARTQIQFRICVVEEQVQDQDAICGGGGGGDNATSTAAEVAMDVVNEMETDSVGGILNQVPLAPFIKEEMDVGDPPPAEENNIPFDFSNEDVPISGIKVDDNSSETSTDSTRTIVRTQEVRIYSCDQCSFQTPIGTRMETHLQSHETDEKHFPCSESDCSMKFSLELSLSLHLRLRHSDFTRTRMECDICGVFVKPGTSWKKHLRITHPNDRIFECELCGNMFGNYVKFIDHSRLHPGKQLRCALCPNQETELLTLEDKLPRHIDEIHGISHFRLKCTFPRCSQIFYSAEQLHLHENQSHKSFHCHECNMDFPTSNLLHDHRLDVHPKIFRCDLCRKSFSNGDSLESHKIAKHDHPKPKCPKCPEKIFSSGISLKHHQAARHSEHEHEERFKCSKCPKEFPRKFQRDSHENSHTAKKVHGDFCQPCGSPVRTKTERWQHLKCMIRSKSNSEVEFPTHKLRMRMKAKSRRHNRNIKLKYHCHLCGQPFNRQMALLRHKDVEHAFVVDSDSDADMNIGEECEGVSEPELPSSSEASALSTSGNSNSENQTSTSDPFVLCKLEN